MVSKKQIKQISKLKLDVALEAMKFTMRSQYKKNDEWLPLIRPPTWLINIETFKSFSQLLVYTSASCLIENTRKRRLQPKHTTRFPWSLLENKPQGIINPPKKKWYITQNLHIFLRRTKRIYKIPTITIWVYLQVCQDLVNIFKIGNASPKNSSHCASSVCALATRSASHPRSSQWCKGMFFFLRSLFRLDNLCVFVSHHPLNQRSKSISFTMQQLVFCDSKILIWKRPCRSLSFACMKFRGGMINANSCQVTKRPTEFQRWDNEMMRPPLVLERSLLLTSKIWKTCGF